METAVGKKSLGNICLTVNFVINRKNSSKKAEEGVLTPVSFPRARNSADTSWGLGS